MTLSKRNIRLDLSPLARARYERIRNTELVKTSEAQVGTRLGANGALLARDLWASFYEPSARVDKTTSGAGTRRLADLVSQAVSDSGKMQGLAHVTRGSVISSAEALAACCDIIESMELPPPPEDKEIRTMQKDNGDKTQVQVDGNSVTVSMTVNGQTISKTHDFDSAADRDKLVDSVEKKAAQRGFGEPTIEYGDPDHDAALNAAIDKIESDPVSLAKIAIAAQQASQEALDSISDRESVYALLYGSEAATDTVRDPSEGEMKQVDALTSAPGFRSFLEMIGRFYESMRSSDIPERVRGSLFVSGVEFTDKIERLTPSELGLFTIEDTSLHQLTRLVGRKTFGYSKSQIGSMDRGSFFVVLDTSESMSWDDKNWPQPAAFAAAAALMAAAENRTVTVATFNTELSDITADLSTPSGRADFMLSMMRIQPSGGTDFNPVVNRAKSCELGTDVLLISDGVGPLNEDAAKEVFSARRLSYLVIGQESAVHPALRAISGDLMVTTQSLTTDSAVRLAAQSSISR
jgi:hypothetical protein